MATKERARKKSKARTESISPFPNKIKAMEIVRQLQAHNLAIRIVRNPLTHPLDLLFLRNIRLVGRNARLTHKKPLLGVGPLDQLKLRTKWKAGRLITSQNSRKANAPSKKKELSRIIS